MTGQREAGLGFGVKVTHLWRVLNFKVKNFKGNMRFSLIFFLVGGRGVKGLINVIVFA